MVFDNAEHSLPSSLHLVSCLLREIQHLRETIEFYELNFIEIQPDLCLAPDPSDESSEFPEEQISEMPCSG